MAIQVSYPGVYIDEFAPASPIQGAGTSTAAFLGLNAYGSPMTPTLLTNWDAYLALFAPPAPTPPDDAAKPAQFLAGDTVLVDNEPATVARTSGTIVYLTDNVQNGPYANVKLRLAPLVPFATTFRVTGPTTAVGPGSLVPGAIITF